LNAAKTKQQLTKAWDGMGVVNCLFIVLWDLRKVNWRISVTYKRQCHVNMHAKHLLQTQQLSVL